MGITSKRVGAAVGNSVAIIEWYGTGDKLTITVNGINCQFPTYDGYPGSDISREDTIKALKEAVAEL